jgi:hypothetical protein
MTLRPPVTALAAALLATLAGASAAADIRTSTTFAPLDRSVAGMFAADDRTLVTIHTNPLGVVTRRADATGAFVEQACIDLPGQRYSNLARADVNGDGLTDLTLYSNNESMIHVLLAQADGSYLPAAKSPYPAPAPFGGGLAFGDLDQAGTPDLLVSVSGGIARYPNLGDGEFGFPSIIAPTAGGQELIVADFKGIGTNQIAVRSGSTIALLERNGDLYDVTVSRGTSSDIFRIHAANPLPDGRTPILAARAHGRVQTLTFLPGSNTFEIVNSPTAGNGATAYDAAFADINADGTPDLAMAYAGSSLLALNLSDPDAPSGYTPSPGVGFFDDLFRVAALDVNADGLADTVHAFAGPQGLITFMQDADHGFRVHGTVGDKDAALYAFLPINAPGTPPAFFVPRFDHASQPDPNQLVTILPKGPGHEIVTSDFQGPPASINGTRWAAADLDADGRLDLVQIRRIPDTNLTLPRPHALFFHRLLHDGSYAAPTEIPFVAVQNLTTPVVADLNRDGVDDVAAMDELGTAFVFFGVPGAGPSDPVEIRVIPEPDYPPSRAFGAFMAADLDADGHVDLIGANRQPEVASVSIAYGLGNAQFETPVSMPAPPNAGGQISPAQATGDLNDDGILDIAITGSGQSVVYFSQGPRSYAPFQPVSSPGYDPGVLFITDFTADGRDELILTYAGFTEVVSFEQGQPRPDPARFLTPSTIETIRFEDLTGDNLPDMLVASSQGISIIYNTSTTHCEADVNADGLLNFFDISAFITLYNTSDTAADLAAPFGTLNFFDIAAYITLYNAGCP